MNTVNPSYFRKCTYVVNCDCEAISYRIPGSQNPSLQITIEDPGLPIFTKIYSDFDITFSRVYTFSKIASDKV